jgi:UDP-N-acetylglucosamine 2-epimerase (non-hydrolysing)/GDP/UDP-N,N'-diacetylbacillosamine 2-epimerase (hydrolysing)
MRTVGVLTTSRADYSHLYWVLRSIEAHPELDLRLIVSGAHLSHEFGQSVREIEADGFTVQERVESLLSSDTDVGMAKTIGLATLGLAEVLDRMRPDLLLLIADRYEMLAPASVALALRIPIAHIEGGEVSEGAVDDAVRNALTKLAHIHFTPTERATTRVLALGEEPWRVHRTGAPSLDHLTRGSLLAPEELARELGVEPNPETVVVAYHPLTLARDTLRETDELVLALERIARPIVFCFPNADAGARRWVDRCKSFCDARPEARLFVNLHPTRYLGLLQHVGVMLGNSSSGIMETASFELPTVNVGLRQAGRERAANVIDAEPTHEAILSAVESASRPEFRDSLSGMSNPYGDGRASERIVKVLAATRLGEELLRKRPVDHSESS